MKKIILLLSLLITLFSFQTTSVAKAETSFYARNYIVMDAYSREVLEGKDIKKSYSVASISKIMTAIIALESDKLFNIIEVDDIINTIEGSSLYLSIGDKITIIDLVYGLMLRSGNDAAVLIAKNVAGDVQRFVSIMNTKAQEIGMKNTTFNNPSGLDIFDAGNISSCYDMALLMSYCMENELFQEIVRTKSYKNNIKGVWENKNKLLKQYKYCIGGKTGYTRKAKRTLVTTAQKDDQRLIVVTFDCGSDFSFHRSLYEKIFNNYIYLIYLNIGKNYIDEYVIESDKVIGMRISYEDLEGGIKIYHINIDNNSVTIMFSTPDKMLNGGEFEGVRLINQ